MKSALQAHAELREQMARQTEDGRVHRKSEKSEIFELERGSRRVKANEEKMLKIAEVERMKESMKSSDKVGGGSEFMESKGEIAE